QQKCNLKVSLVLNSFSAYQQYIQLIKLIHLHIKY
ncbi:unnamed protein product, partial [Leptidea sinapis]